MNEKYTDMRTDSYIEEQMMVAHCLLDPAWVKQMAAMVNPSYMVCVGPFREIVESLSKLVQHQSTQPAGADVVNAIEAVMRNYPSAMTDLRKRFEEAEKEIRSGDFYIRRVVDRAGRRRLLDELKPEQLLNGTWTTGEALGKARELILDIGRFANTAAGRGGKLANNYHENVKALERRLDGHETTTINTGFGALDELLGGVEAASYNVIGARPSIGKTAVSVNLALSMAKQGIRVMFITLEVAYDKLLEQMACCHNGLRKRLIHHAASQATRSRLSETYEAVHRLPIELHSDCDDIGQIIGLIEDAVTRDTDPVQAVFVDYLQIIRSRRRVRDDLEKLNMFSGGFRQLKKDHKVALFIAAQLNRRSAAGEPKLEDLKGTGDIEQDADMVMLLDRPNKELAEREDATAGMDKTVRDDQLNMLIKKNRFGRTGRVSYHWDATTGVISEMTDDEVEAQRLARQHVEGQESDKRSYKYGAKDNKQRQYRDGSLETKNEVPF